MLKINCVCSEYDFQMDNNNREDSWQHVYSAGVVTINYIVYTHSNTQTNVSKTI